MPDKFNRNYKLDIFTPEGKQITITPPLSIKFNIVRNTLASANTGKITLYNLGPASRNIIFKDRYSTTENWKVILYAGYGKQLFKVADTEVLEAYSYKDKTEWITELSIFDGFNAIQNGYTAETVAADTSMSGIISKIVSGMPDIIPGFIGSIGNQPAAPRGKTLLGPSVELLDIETDGNFFIDLKQVNVLAENEVINSGEKIVELTPGTLLTTPRRRDTFLDISTLFEPQVKPGHYYKITSLEPRFNGQYKVLGFTHDVTISGAECGNAYTNISLEYRPEGYQEVLA